MGGAREERGLGTNSSGRSMNGRNFMLLKFHLRTSLPGHSVAEAGLEPMTAPLPKCEMTGRQCQYHYQLGL